MPNLYDRALGDTEINLLNQIIAKIHTARKQSQEFEVPLHGGVSEDNRAKPLSDSTADSTDVASAASFVKEGEIDISKLEEED